LIRDPQIMAGGPQGSGLETVAQVLAPAFASRGLGVTVNREYYSNIVGRHSYIHMRISSSGKARSLSYPTDVLAAIDAETIFMHWDELSDSGYLILDEGVMQVKLRQITSMEHTTRNAIMDRLKSEGIDATVEGIANHLSSKGVRIVKLPFKEILAGLREEYGLTRIQASRYKSSLLIGAIAGLTGLSDVEIETGLRKRFKQREKLIEINKKLVAKVRDSVASETGVPMRLPKSEDRVETLVASGNDVIAMAKIVAGIRFQAYYPITPASDESVFLEARESINVGGKSLGDVIVLQTEDEIAAITAAIGASLAGARAATSTSGPGFSLMVEALGWAGINEAPVVITYYQRGGPSTGLPTRGSQSDLLFTLHAGHGEFPRVVIASGDHEEAFIDAIEAFNIAERYQLPVIHLLDKFLANTVATMPLPRLGSVRIDRGNLVLEGGEGPTTRFPLSEPAPMRPAIGSGYITWYTGDEHDEWGHINEDSMNRLEMYRRRMMKLEIASKEIPDDFMARVYGDENPEYLLVGWGSVKNTALDAIEELGRLGYRVAYLHLRVFSPFPRDPVSRVLSSFDAEKVIAVEHNYLGQASRIASLETGFRFRKFILKWTGRPIYLDELIQGFLAIVKDGKDEVVLSRGK